MKRTVRSRCRSAFIDILDPMTGKSTGRKAKVDRNNRDLENCGPWYSDEEGVYAVATLLGAQLKIYMHDVVMSRRHKSCILADGHTADPHWAHQLARQGAGEQPRRAHLVRVHAVPVQGQPGMYDFHTHGLQQMGHKEMQVIAPGLFSGYVVTMLYFREEGIADGERYEIGGTCDNGVLCRYEEVPGEKEGEPTRIRIRELPFTERKDEEGVTFSICDPKTGTQSAEGRLPPEHCDLAKAVAWHEDRLGVYTVVPLMGAYVKTYMNDVLSARQDKYCIVTSGHSMDPHNTDNEFTDGRVDISCAEPEDGQGMYLFCTQGLEARGHKELQLMSTGFCNHMAVALLHMRVDKIGKGERFEAGHTEERGGFTLKYEESPAVADTGGTCLRMVDVTQGERVFCEAKGTWLPCPDGHPELVENGRSETSS